MTARGWLIRPATAPDRWSPFGDAGEGLYASTTKRRRHYTYIPLDIGRADVVHGETRTTMAADLAVTGTEPAGPGLPQQWRRHLHRRGTLSSSTSPHRWGDYDNDATMDIAQAGAGSLLNSYSSCTQTGAGTSSESSASHRVNSPSLAWCDCDNDRDVDLACCGLSGRSALTHEDSLHEQPTEPHQCRLRFTGAAERGGYEWGATTRNKRIEGVNRQTSGGYVAAI